MNLFRILGLKLQEELNKSFFILEDIGFLKFEDVIAFLEGKKTQNNVDILVRKGKIKKQVSSLLENPSVFTPVNSFIESTQIGNNGFYSGKGILNGEICIINKMSDFENKDYKGKIIIIENATPEIDIYLKNIKGIITKNGGPLSHIMIRARELLIPAVVGTSKYEEIIKINPKNLEICFEAKEIIF